MLSTAISVLAAIALLLPGFIVVEISLARSARASRSDLELALRALVYTLALHLVFGIWTAGLVDKIEGSEDWPDHLWPLSLYAIVVLLVVPVAVGLILNRYLAAAETSKGPVNVIAAALGAGEARDAFDFAYQRWRKAGVYVIVEMDGHTASEPRLIGGIYGEESAVGQTPSPHDTYLESLCTVEEDEHGVRSLSSRIEPDRGVYVPASQIVRVDLVPEPPEDSGTISP